MAANTYFFEGKGTALGKLSGPFRESASERKYQNLAQIAKVEGMDQFLLRRTLFSIFNEDLTSVQLEIGGRDVEVSRVPPDLGFVITS